MTAHQGDGSIHQGDGSVRVLYVRDEEGGEYGLDSLAAASDVAVDTPADPDAALSGATDERVDCVVWDDGGDPAPFVRAVRDRRAMLPCIVVGTDDVDLGRVVTAGATDVLPAATIRDDPDLLVERVERAVTDAAGEYAGRDGAHLPSLTATVETVDAALLVANAAGRVDHVNGALASLAGVSGDDVRGERVGELARRGRLDDEDGDALDAAVRALPESEHDRRDLTVSFEDGTTAECRLRTLPPGRAVSGTVVTVRDVTAIAERRRRLDALDDALRALAAATDRETVCATAVEAAAELLDLPLCGIWRHDEDAGRLQPVAATAPVHDELGGLPHVRQGDGLAWDAFASGEPAAYEDIRTREGLYDLETSARSELVLPLDTRGLLLAGALTPTEFDRERVQVATAFATAVATALKRVEASGVEPAAERSRGKH